MGCARGARKRTGLRRNVCGDGFALLPGMRAQVRSPHLVTTAHERRPFFFYESSQRHPGLFAPWFLRPRVNCESRRPTRHALA